MAKGKGKKKKKSKKAKKKQEIDEIVRLLATDLDGKKKIKNSLRKIKGIGFTMAKVFCERVGVDPEKVTGTLKEKERKKLEEVIKNPNKFDIPPYIYNLRKDPKTGKNDHYIGGELEIKTKQIIDSMKKLGSYRGVRHRLGLPVRGQRTKSSFRSARIVGVSRKKLKERKAEAKEE